MLFTQRLLQVVLFFLMLVDRACFAESIEWTRQLGTSGNNYAEGVSADSSGAFVVGTTVGNLFATSAGDFDAFLARYDAAGSLQWARQLGSRGGDDAQAVSADHQGSVYVAGSTNGSLFGTNLGQNDAIVAKLDSAGNLLWGRQFGTNREDIGWGVSADGLGNVYVTGQTLGNIGGPNQGHEDVFVSKFDAAGNQLWSRQWGTIGPDEGWGISADGVGNVYVAGQMVDVYGTPPDLYSDFDSVLLKYDSAGNLQWMCELGLHDTGSFSADQAWAVVADNFGNVYISGETNNDLASPNAGGADAFVAKYDSAGNLLWTRQFGTSVDDSGAGITVDAAGNAYVTGTTASQLGGADGRDTFVRKFSPIGDLIWTKLLGSSKSDFGRGISADDGGNVYFVGETYGNIAGVNAGQADAFIAKLAGVPEPSTTAMTLIALLGMIHFGARKRPS